MGYHEYKTLHLISFVFFLVALTKFKTPQHLRRYSKSFLYSSGFVTVTTGVVLMSRFGLTQEIPLWIWAKFFLMLILVSMIWFPKEDSRLNPYRPLAVYLISALAIFFSVYKPF